MIIIGLGTGRSGTTSLAHFLGKQDNSFVFHEMNPSAMRFSGTKAPVLNTIREFDAILAGGDSSLLTLDLSRPPTVQAYERLCEMKQINMLGDIAFYYLSYVEDILEITEDVRFVCMKRNKTATVKSWLKKTKISRWRSKWIADIFTALIQRTPFYGSKNFWMEHDGTKWLLDPVWDKCFPKFDAASKEDAVAQYYDFYYEEAERYAEKYPDVFKIFTIDDLNSVDGVNNIMDFCGFPKEGRDVKTLHIHRIPD